MTYRLPVIVSNIPANAEIGLDQKAYFLVDDELQLTEKIKKAIDTPLQRIDYLMDDYNWNVIAEQVSEVYKKVIC